MLVAANPAPSYTNPDPRAVAIVGMSISAPGGEGVDHGLDTEEFYEFLSRRGIGTIKVPADRWNADAFHGTGPGQICTTTGCFIADINWNDPQELGINADEANQMAITQLGALHQAFNALQRSGVDFRGTTTGVYVGCASPGRPCEPDPTECREYYMTGSSSSIVANRISFVFDMMGPSLPVDTACSSSLTAMHLALQAIRNGECDQAVVAGTNAIIGPLETTSFSALGVLSPDGMSKSFDDSANGYSRGDLMSAVVIKRHDLAVADGDYIHATLVGSALTSCGSLMGSLTTPSAEAQILAIRNAYRDARLSPSQVDFIELHGTGTVVGDSIEANAAGSVFSEGRNGREIIMGSVKSNIGHGEMGAYMSSLIKTVFMLENSVVLPNGFFEKPSQKIKFQEYNLRVPVEVEKLEPADPNNGIIASISSFGFGGACGHTVLRSHDRRPVHKDFADGNARSGPYLFAIGGWSPRATSHLVNTYKQDFANVSPWALSEHLGSRARQAPFRTFAVADSIADCKFPDPVIVAKRPPHLILSFSGQGPQHWAMGRELFSRFSVFRESILASDAVHREYTGSSFIHSTGLFLPNAPEDSLLEKTLLWPADVISVGMAFFQIALFDLLTYLGVKPDALVGHSLGETAVLYASGAMPREMVIRIAVARGRALRLVDGIGGSMVAVGGCDADTVQDHIDATMDIAPQGIVEPGDSLYIAAYNSLTDIGVSGPEKLIDELTKFISDWVEGVKATKLRVSTAVHSRYVNPCEETYRRELEAIFAQYPDHQAPSIPTMSTVTADWVEEQYSIDYLWRNLRQPVQFAPAISSLVGKYGEMTSFVEIAPHPVLTPYLKALGAHEVVSGSKRPPSARHLQSGVKPYTEVHTLLECFGQLMLAGVNSMNLARLNGCQPDRVKGPEYPFQKKYRPFATLIPSYAAKRLPRHRPLNSERLRVSPLLPEPWMADHIIDGSVIIPAAAYMEMLLEFPNVTAIYDCSFDAACVLDPAASPVTIEVKKLGNFVTIKSSEGLETMQGDLSWTVAAPIFDTQHACGKLGYGIPPLGPRTISHVDIDEILARCPYSHSREELYDTIFAVAQFGPEFKRINRAVSNEWETICWIRGSTGLNQREYHVHPTILDACIQGAIIFNLQHERINVDNANREFLLPHSLERAFRNDGSTTPLNLPDETMVLTRLLDWSPDRWMLDAYILAENGDVLFTIEGMWFEKVQQGSLWPEARLAMEWYVNPTNLYRIDHQPQMRQTYALPRDEVLASRVLKGISSEVEEVALLQALDRLAVSCTQHFVSSLPLDFAVALPDRQRYLEWCRSQTLKHAVEPPENVLFPLKLRERFRVLFELSDRVGKGQKEICLDSTAAVDILFSDDIMSRIYEFPPFRGPIFDSIPHEFVRLVNRIRAAGKRVLRILEVGAGTGRLTAILGQAFNSADIADVHIDYVCSDISIALAQEAAAHCPWLTVTPMALDLNLPLGEQGVDLASFDIVTAFDVIHATPSIQRSIESLRSLLVPGGYLAVIELDGKCFDTEAAGSIWMDWIFGSFREWFGVLNMRGPAAKHYNQANIVDHLMFFAQATESTTTCSSHGQSTPMEGASFSVASSDDRSNGLVTPPDDVATGLPSPLRTDKPKDDKISDDSLQSMKPSSPPTTGPLTPAPSLHDVPSESVSIVTALQTASPTRDASIRTLVHSFKAGDELAMVSFFSSLDTGIDYTIWLHATTNEDDATIIGLTRSVRHEFGMFKIRLALFDSSWSAARRNQFIHAHLIPLPWIDAEVLVDKTGSISVPRIVAESAPSTTVCIGENPVCFGVESRKVTLWRAFPPPLGPNDVEVQVSGICISSIFENTAEFSGRLSALGSEVNGSKYYIGQRVCGIACSPKGSVIVTDASHVVAIPDTWSLFSAAATVGRIALSSVVGAVVQPACSRQTHVIFHAGSGSSAAETVYRAIHSKKRIDIYVTADPPVAGIFTEHGQVVVPTSDTAAWSLSIRQWCPAGSQYALIFDCTEDILRETLSLLGPRGTLVCVGVNESVAPGNLKPSQRFLSISHEELASDLPLEDYIPDIDTALAAELIPAYSVVSLRHLQSANVHKLVTSRQGPVLVDFEQKCPNLRVLKGGVMPGTHAFDPRKSYVLIGGMGSLGVVLARMIIEMGARHVVLTSRSGENLPDGRLIREKRIVRWLRSLPGVRVDLEALDCLDAENTKDLFRSLPNPVGGVFHLAVCLNDSLFTNLTTEEDWSKVYDVKVKGFRILLDAINHKDVDFLVLASSMAATVGSPGQANYAAAQTWMEAIATKIPNATTIAVPPLVDGGVFVRAMPKGSRNAALDRYTALGMSGYQLAHHCVEAIWSIGTERPMSNYIPSTDWKMLLELSTQEYTQSLIRHLVSKDTTRSSRKNSEEQTIRGACAAVLALEPCDIDDSVPLSSYGLDSLTSVRLSGLLKQHFGIAVTQMQLLGGSMTVARLETMREEQVSANAVSGVQASDASDEPEDTLQEDMANTVVRLNDAKEGKPVFIIHGAGGGVLILQKMAKLLSFPVYGVQDTAEAPVTGTLRRLSSFYLQKIREKQPHGPYRLAGFSFGTAMALDIAVILRDEGEEVESIVMIDGSPTLFERPSFSQYTLSQVSSGDIRNDIMDMIEDMAHAGILDHAEDLPSQFSGHLIKGVTGSPWIRRFCSAYTAHLLMGVRATMSRLKVLESPSQQSSWPTEHTVLIKATNGVATQSYVQGASPLFDLDKYTKKVKVYELDGSHFSILHPRTGIADVMAHIYQ
ncbi:polyketide synthase [Gloeophyllum trabeum ATCC 11539]|uniref:Polyketide synthase n=1 Tax=Gloeophyllum trabeum (strain ATCC 11539 / FP-39264 / Madison 617) TaxID=670483 RepID=S7PXH6_GLOTA|nr:polyketide synthase [Gloeophyllum trabeum ATCC 11539]EPQ51987.1 polyketide synthase [Gloeophyllum trabeum ATCC 11539]